LVRSPHHHARILAIDPAPALALPGVVAVLTHADVPAAETIGPFVADQPVLAAGVVRHVGEPVALVVAQTRAQAQAAVRAVAVTYEPLPAVLDPQAALEPGAPAVHPAGNLCAEYLLEAGDIEAGFAAADVVVEETFTVQRISPAYLEPETSLAAWQPDGSLVVWTSSQKPFVDRKEIAAVVGLPLEQVIVRNAEVGGAFGGKEDSILAVLAGLAASCTRASVLLANERWESFVGHPKRHPATVTLRLGARQDGQLTALSARVHLDTGAYASYGPAVGSQMTELVPGPYRTPNVRVETSVCYTHSPYSGAMRGFGNPQAAFALESLLDSLAGRLGIDPIELRRINRLRPGDRMATGVTAGAWADSFAGVLDAAQQAADRLRAQPGEADGETSVGVGAAFAMQCMGLGYRVPDRSSQRVEWLPDGQVRLWLGAPEIGQGLATSAERMLAEALGIPAGQVTATGLDTALVPDGGVTCASRMTYLVGNALQAAAEALQAEILRQAAGLMQVDASGLRYERGRILTAQGTAIPAAEIAARLAELDHPLEATGSADFPYPDDMPDHLPVGLPHALFVFGGHVARVAVDAELGQVRVTDLVAIHDPGRVIFPSGAVGQVQGGVAMGLGYALYEDMALKRGGQWVNTLAEYLLPTSADMPERVEVVLLETPEASSAFGVKGLGEIVTVPTAPAVANAVADATGRRVTRLPITSERLAA
jgi:CO/xanthine dehydrogenase Mo-binding subunit